MYHDRAAVRPKTGEVVLQVDGVSKKFAHQIRRAFAYGARDMLGEILPPLRHQGLRPGEFWAIHDLTLQVRQSEAVALIGHNGAGKSTFLKILYGLIKPDSGTVRIAGRTEGIIDLGAGINPLLSGRENIELAAALHGLDRHAARRFLEEVIAFADIDEFIDVPMRSYSSGMKARLSFAVSALRRPDLLLLDEVLAVGDLAFQRKCLTFIRRYLDGGGALIFVSHNLFQIQTICGRGVLLEEGRRMFDGPIVEAIDLLLRSRRFQPPTATGARIATAPVTIDGIAAAAAGVGIAADTAGDGIAAAATDEGRIVARRPLRLRLRYTAAEPIEVAWGFSIWTHDQLVVVAGEHCATPRRLAAGKGELSCVIEKPPFVGGRYVVRAAMLDPETKQPLALFGFHDAPAEIVVDEPLDYAATVKMAQHQLVHLDVRWD